VASDDVLALALHMTRAGFAARFPDAILVGDGSIVSSPSSATRTMIPAVSLDEITTITRKSTAPLPTAFLFAIRKLRSASTDPISIGRLPSSDILITDESVSKVHAHFFKTAGQPLGLADAGSMNGTWAAEKRLSPGSPPIPVTPGTKLRFGLEVLTMVDSGAFWDRIRTPTAF
jgi:pSer/pThr/pTyr-binding forkhead associated (FHA) protein